MLQPIRARSVPNLLGNTGQNLISRPAQRRSKAVLGWRTGRIPLAAHPSRRRPRGCERNIAVTPPLVPPAKCLTDLVRGGRLRGLNQGVGGTLSRLASPASRWQKEQERRAGTSRMTGWWTCRVVGVGERPGPCDGRDQPLQLCQDFSPEVVCQFFVPMRMTSLLPRKSACRWDPGRT